MSGQNVPDLAQILRNLAAYQPSQESTAASHESFLTRSPIPSSVPGPSHSSPLPSRGAAQASSLPPGDTSQASNRGWYGNHSSSGRRTDQVLGDPSAITEWGPGLRHVSKLATLNPEFERTVVELIADQRAHEVEWFNGREALLAKQASRDENSVKLDAIFRSIGGSVASSSPMTSQDKEMELQQYDEKVYRASHEMYRAFSNRLGRLGVPFFCGNENGCKELQAKMIKHLEEMYGSGP